MAMPTSRAGPHAKEIGMGDDRDNLELKAKALHDERADDAPTHLARMHPIGVVVGAFTGLALGALCGLAAGPLGSLAGAVVGAAIGIFAAGSFRTAAGQRRK